MTTFNKDEYKKSLIAKGLSEDDADEMSKALPDFLKKEEGDEKDEKDEKDKVAKALADQDPEKLAKAVQRLQEELGKPHGLSEAEVNEKIEKAVTAAKTPLEQHAVAISAVTDSLIQSQQQHFEVLNKSILGLVDISKGLVDGFATLRTATKEDGEKVAKSVAAVEGVAGALGKALETMQKSVSAAQPVAQPAVALPQAITEATVIAHPGEPTPDKALWTREEVLQKAVEINKTNADRANKIRADLMAFTATGTALRHNLTKE